MAIVATMFHVKRGEFSLLKELALYNLHHPHDLMHKANGWLLREMGSGLLVTELLGQGVNYVTGDYSRGAAGYWVEKGEIAYPVEEITIAGNLREMLRGIAAIGRDIEVRGSKQVGSILVERMTIAGT